MILFDHFIRIPPLKASLRSLRCGFFFCRGFKYLRTSPKSHHPYSWRCNLRREERDSRKPPPLNPRFAASFRHRTASDGFSLGPQFGSRCPPLFSGFNSSFFFFPPSLLFFLATPIPRRSLFVPSSSWNEWHRGAAFPKGHRTFSLRSTNAKSSPSIPA